MTTAHLKHSHSSFRTLLSAAKFWSVAIFGPALCSSALYAAVLCGCSGTSERELSKRKPEAKTRALYAGYDEVDPQATVASLDCGAASSTTFSSISQMLAHDFSGALGSDVYVEGFREPGDGAEGCFRVVESDVNRRVDGVVVHATANGAYHLLRLHDGSIDVHVGGAVGDGVANDTLAVRAALDTGFDITASGDTFLVGAGGSGDACIGEHQRAVLSVRSGQSVDLGGGTLRLADQTHCTLLANQATLFGGSDSDISLTNMIIDGNESAQSVAQSVHYPPTVHLLYVSRLSISNVTVNDFFAAGMHIGASGDISFVDVTVRAGVGTGINMTGERVFGDRIDIAGTRTLDNPWGVHPNPIILSVRDSRHADGRGFGTIRTADSAWGFKLQNGSRNVDFDQIYALRNGRHAIKFQGMCEPARCNQNVTANYVEAALSELSGLYIYDTDGIDIGRYVGRGNGRGYRMNPPFPNANYSDIYIVRSNVHIRDATSLEPQLMALVSEHPMVIPEQPAVEQRVRRIDSLRVQRLASPHNIIYLSDVPHAFGDVVLVDNAEQDSAWLSLASRSGAPYDVVISAFFSDIPFGSTSTTSPAEAFHLSRFPGRLRVPYAKFGPERGAETNPAFSFDSALSSVEQPPVEKWSDSFGAEVGFTTYDEFPRFLADVSGDGLSDIVAHGGNGIVLSRSDGFRRFKGYDTVSTEFTYADGFQGQNATPLAVGDVDGDRRADLVGFRQDGTYVSLWNGSRFADRRSWSSDGHCTQDFVSFEETPRFLGDVDGDGTDDVICHNGTSWRVDRSTGVGFEPYEIPGPDFACEGGQFCSFSAHPFAVGDVDGDGRDDVVGFGEDGTYVSFSTNNGFAPRMNWSPNFGQSTGFLSFEAHPRFLADVDGDGDADVIAHAGNAWVVAHSNRIGAFEGYRCVEIRRLTNQHGFGDAQITPFAVGSVNRGPTEDLIAFGPDGVQVMLSSGIETITARCSL